jgi:uncharacterized delta-60 repeat protein
MRVRAWKQVLMDSGKSECSSARSAVIPVLQVAAIGILLAVASANAAQGRMDHSFSPAIPDGISAIAVQEDGRILVAGAMVDSESIYHGMVVRLHPDGSRDESFSATTGTNSSVRSIVLQPDGKVIIGGRFTSVNSVGRNGIARLLSDGSLDNSFNPGTGIGRWPGESIDTVAVQADGKVLAGGNFSSFDGIQRRSFGRLDSDGSLDANFAPEIESGRVRCVVVQADGRIVIGGSFSTSGNDYRNIARFHVDGSGDATFQVNAVSPDVASMALQADGKLLIGGGMTDSLYGTPYPQIARLDGNGGWDSSFNPGSGAYGPVYAIAVQPDGKMVIGGSFTSVNGTSRIRIARLHSDGSIDESFDPGLGLSGPCNPFCPSVSSIALQTDGKVVALGSFSTVNGMARKYLTRLFGDPLPRLIALSFAPEGRVLRGIAATNAHLRLDASSDLLTWTAVSQFVNTTGAFEQFDGQGGTATARFYRLVWLP